VSADRRWCGRRRFLRADRRNVAQDHHKS
jgi:hypothetical protein